MMMAVIADAGLTPRSAASDDGLHCLPLSCFETFGDKRATMTLYRSPDYQTSLCQLAFRFKRSSI